MEILLVSLLKSSDIHTCKSLEQLLPIFTIIVFVVLMY